MADSSMSIGLSGILAAQTALNIAGENITNSTTPGYALRQVQLSETAPTGPEANTETGVNADTIVRDCNMYLEGQEQSYNAGLSSATTMSQYLNQIQALLQEPNSTNNGISTQLDTFFNDWQSLAADPNDSTTQSTLIDAAQQLAQSLQALQSSLVSVQSSVDQDLSSSVTQVNQLTSELAQNNQLIANATSNGSTPLSLEDQRDSLMDQLAQLTGTVNTSPQQSTAQVQIAGTTLVSGSTSTTLNASTGVNGQATVTAGDGNQASSVSITTGTIGALLQLSQTTIPGYLQQLNNFTSGLISMVNQQYAEGVSQNGPSTSVTATNSVSDANAMLAEAGLPATPTQGQLTINVVDNATGAQTPVTISVNPSAESLNDLATAINNAGGGNLTATVSDGALSIAAASGSSFDFAADQGTNILASLGINSFFQGTNASNIQVADALVNNPADIAAGQTADSGDGSNAAAISNLETAASSAFGGNSMAGYWQTVVSGIGSDAENATETQTTAQNMVTTVTSQEQAISGVSLDEEAANVLQYQQMYTDCAHYMATVGQLTQTLLSYISGVS
ncbi:MAG: flagellar hook-associated protein FlgK [Candidatus Brocadiia bacterium]